MNTPSQDFWLAVHKYNYNKIPRLLRLHELGKLLTPSLTDTLRKISFFAVKHPPTIDRNRSVYLLSTDKLIRIRGKGNAATANRHLNILCAVGLFKKLYQDTGDPDGLVKGNRDFLNYRAEVKTPMNAIRIPKWSPEFLQTVEERARILNTNGITAGNISDNKLMAAGLTDISEEIYTRNYHSSFGKKLEGYEQILTFIDHSISVSGYCSKTLIYDNLISEIEPNEIKRLFVIFSDDLKSRYYYHKPTGSEREQFDLTSGKYIYTARGGHGCGE